MRQSYLRLHRRGAHELARLYARDLRPIMAHLQCKHSLRELVSEARRGVCASRNPAKGCDMTDFPNEEVLPDDYPIYGDYLYVADGKLYRSDWHGISVRSLKAREGFKEVRR